MSADPPLTIKLICKAAFESDQDTFLRQVPDDFEQNAGIRFTVDPSTQEYDWLVVYDELPHKHPLYATSSGYELCCPPQQTMLITVEPSSIKTYGSDYLSQFGVVLTSQEPWAIDLPIVVRSQPALRWFYGAGTSPKKTWHDLASSSPDAKSKLISNVCSSKTQRHTEHHARYQFSQFLNNQIPGMELFGRGVNPIADKTDALDAFKYHIAVENHYAQHHWTEKLADAFLGLTLPFYYGCPNAADYFPEESFVPVDIHRPDQALKIIQREIAENGYERRLDAIREARRRVLEEYNLITVVSRLARERHSSQSTRVSGARLYSRHVIRKQSVRQTAKYLLERYQVRRHNRANVRLRHAG